MGATANYGNVTGTGQRCAISAANANRDGTGTVVTLATGAANGMRIDDIAITALVTTTAGMVRFFMSFDSGVTNDLILEIPVPAVTASATAPAFSRLLTNLAIILPNNTAQLRVSTEKAEAFRVVVTRKGDF